MKISITRKYPLDKFFRIGVLAMNIREENDNIPMNLLLLADPSEKSIAESIYHGRCYVLEDNGLVKGAFIITPNGLEKMVIKNIAVDEKFQNNGLGKLMLKEAIQIATEQGYKVMEVSTGNSSIGQLAFYQKFGFRMISIEKNYFVMHYEEEIYENEIRCYDLIHLSRELGGI